MTHYDIVDLYAGPGGWSVAARLLGLYELGIEWDQAAVDTARNAGHVRSHMDVTRADPRDHRGLTTLIASPPCQAFSSAGQGLGRAAIVPLTEALAMLHRGEPIETVRAFVNAACHDPRAALVIEPMHWIIQAQPRNVALEQVPPVLPLWQAMAAHMRQLGYYVAVGNLSAEQYDVPQTRKRAILVASLDRPVALPVPVRAKYRKGAEPDPSLSRWLSMAEALGWGMTAQPSMTVTAGGTTTGGAEPFGNGARKGMRRELEAGRWMMAQAGATSTMVDPRPFSQPSGTITTKATAAWTMGDRKHGARVSLAEASVLQGFPVDYPWAGSKTAGYRQVGDAVPPPLAWHVLRAMLGLSVEHYPGLVSYKDMV